MRERLWQTEEEGMPNPCWTLSMVRGKGMRHNDSMVALRPVSGFRCGEGEGKLDK